MCQPFKEQCFCLFSCTGIISGAYLGRIFVCDLSFEQKKTGCFASHYLFVPLDADSWGTQECQNECVL